MANSEVIKIGLGEAAHFESGLRKLTAPLTDAIRVSKALGFEFYEAMPSPATTFEVLTLQQRDPKITASRLEVIGNHVVNIHPDWLIDRLVHQAKAANDSCLDYLKRWPVSLAVSSPFLSVPAMRVIERASGATVSWHWPVLAEQREGLKNQWSQRFQRHLASVGGKLVAENHALFPLDNDQLH